MLKPTEISRSTEIIAHFGERRAGRFGTSLPQPMVYSCTPTIGPMQVATAPDRLPWTRRRRSRPTYWRPSLALLIGFVLDQQVPLQKAFIGPLRSAGASDARRTQDRHGHRSARGRLRPTTSDPPLSGQHGPPQHRARPSCTITTATPSGFGRKQPMRATWSGGCWRTRRGRDEGQDLAGRLGQAGTQAGRLGGGRAAPPNAG